LDMVEALTVLVWLDCSVQRNAAVSVHTSDTPAAAAGTLHLPLHRRWWWPRLAG
jgi:hypothetical protein